MIDPTGRVAVVGSLAYRYARPLGIREFGAWGAGVLATLEGAQVGRVHWREVARLYGVAGCGHDGYDRTESGAVRP